MDSLWTDLVARLCRFPDFSAQLLHIFLLSLGPSHFVLEVLMRRGLLLLLRSVATVVSRSCSTDTHEHILKHGKQVKHAKKGKWDTGE